MKAFIPFPLMLVIMALLVVPAAACQEEWTCNVQLGWGAIDGVPRDDGTRFGVRPGATDGYELDDSKKPPEPPYGEYIYAFFEHPTWGHAPIMADWRAPLPEGTTKQWGIDPPNPSVPPTDYWAVKISTSGVSAGCPDPCGYGETYPVAVSIYITWEFGVSEFPPLPLPPEDYTFVIKYMGGLNAKPAGCAEPGVEVPAVGTTWDMEATAYIAVPIWSLDFQPYTADCSGRSAPDRAKFFFIVANPDTGPVCQLVAIPDAPQAPPAKYEFTALPGGHGPFTFAWDFGDGAGDAGQTVTHTYTADGTYTVTCALTDVNGDADTCTAAIEVTGDANHPPTCCFEYDPSRPDTGTVVTFTDCSTDPDPAHSVASWSWDFGDGGHSAERNPMHQFAAGDHEVCLTVTDDANAPASTTCCQTLTVGPLPHCCAAGIIETVAGGGNRDGRPATDVSLYCARSVAEGPDGSVYIADAGDHRIRKVRPGGIITTAAGTGEWGYGGDGGPATAAKLHWPSEVVVGVDGSIYIADTSNDRIRKVDPAGIITTVAGDGYSRFAGDGGPATEARLSYPHDVALAVDGSLYIADTGNGRIRMVDPAGIIFTVAGGGDPPAGLGDGGPASEASLASPYGLAVCADDSIYIADTYHNRIRRVGPWGPCYSLGHDPPSADTGEVITFHSNVYDPHGRAATCTWDFGDGTGTVGCDPTHVYAAPGVYRACLTVSNELGNTATSCTEVLVVCSGQADAEITAILTAARGRVARNHRIVVVLRNAGPDACRVRVELRNADNGETIADRVVDLPRRAGNGRTPTLEVFNCRWCRADIGLCRLEASVIPVGVCDPRLENNTAATTVRVRR